MTHQREGDFQLVGHQTNQTQNAARNDVLAGLSNDEAHDSEAKVNKVEQEALSEANKALAAAEKRVVY